MKPPAPLFQMHVSHKEISSLPFSLHRVALLGHSLLYSDELIQLCNNNNEQAVNLCKCSSKHKDQPKSEEQVFLCRPGIEDEAIIPPSWILNVISRGLRREGKKIASEERGESTYRKN